MQEKVLTPKWSEWQALQSLDLTTKKWGKHGINMPLILRDDWEVIQELCSMNPSNDDAKKMQEALVHSVGTLANAHYSDYQTTKATETAEIAMRIKYMQSTSPDDWELQQFINFVNESKSGNRGGVDLVSS